MAAPTQTGSAFPSPYEVPTPPGAEGWQEMYPYHALFHEARREVDEAIARWRNQLERQRQRDVSGSPEYGDENPQKF